MDVDKAEFHELEKQVGTIDTNVVRLQEQVMNLQGIVKELVTKAEFTPVKMIAYGLATMVMGSVFTALLARVIIK